MVSGIRNTACGRSALYFNIDGDRNTAIGQFALGLNTTGSRNTAIGERAGIFQTGSDNIAIGNLGVAGDANTIKIGIMGTHTSTYIAGISGVTTGGVGTAVMIDSSGQLGTISSSRRFKKAIRDMGETTSRLFDLRPVIFRFKEEVARANRRLEYGLIAEEVAEIFPELVIYDDEGRPFTVRYHLLSSMLLNELQKEHQRVEELDTQVRELDGLRAELRALEARLRAIESLAASSSVRARRGGRQPIGDHQQRSGILVH